MKMHPRALMLAISVLLPSCTLSEKHNSRYKGYIGTSVYAKTPIWLYKNVNFQNGPGKGYALKNSNVFGNDGLVGILPTGHPVTFNKAYQSYDLASGATWLEGTTVFKGNDYYVQFALSYGSPDKAGKELYDSFETR
jgi:hypothetical protein